MNPTIQTDSIPDISKHYLSPNKAYEITITYSYPKRTAHFRDDNGNPATTTLDEFCFHINGAWVLEGMDSE